MESMFVKAYGEIFFYNTLLFRNVAEALVSKGLATVVKYRQDDDQRSSKYDDLMTAENKAIKSQLGLHSKKDYPALRVTEIVSFPLLVLKKHIQKSYIFF